MRLVQDNALRTIALGDTEKKTPVVLRWTKCLCPAQNSYVEILTLNRTWDFPGGPVVKNPPSNIGDAGSIPGRGTNIPHAVGQLSLARHNYWARVPQWESLPAANYRAHALWNLCFTTREKPVCRKERSHVPQRRSCVPQLRPNAAKK